MHTATNALLYTNKVCMLNPQCSYHESCHFFQEPFVTVHCSEINADGTLSYKTTRKTIRSILNGCWQSNIYRPASLVFNNEYANVQDPPLHVHLKLRDNLLRISSVCHHFLSNYFSTICEQITQRYSHAGHVPSICSVCCGRESTGNRSG